MFCLRSINPFQQKDPSFEKTHPCFCENMDLRGKRLHNKYKDPLQKSKKSWKEGEGVFPVIGTDAACTSKKKERRQNELFLSIKVLRNILRGACSISPFDRKDLLLPWLFRLLKVGLCICCVTFYIPYPQFRKNKGGFFQAGGPSGENDWLNDGKTWFFWPPKSCKRYLGLRAVSGLTNIQTSNWGNREVFRWMLFFGSLYPQIWYRAWVSRNRYNLILTA